MSKPKKKSAQNQTDSKNCRDNGKHTVDSTGSDNRSHAENKNDKSCQ